MSVVKCACPKCRQPVQIAQALPARIQCPGCGATFSVGAPRAHPPASPRQNFAPPPPMPAEPAPILNDHTLVHAARYRGRSRSNSGAGIWILAGIGLLALFGIGVGAAIYSGVLNPSNRNAANKGGDNDTLPGGDEVLPGGPGVNKDDLAAREAIGKGVEYLKKRLLDPSGNKLFYSGIDDEPNVGAAALAGMTLVECGVPATDPAVKKAIQMVRDAQPTLTYTYSLALCILFLDRLTDPERKKDDVSAADKTAYQNAIRALALRLVAGQHVTGGWNYRVQPLTVAEETRLREQLQKGTFVAGGFKPPPDNNVYRDNSISQFAILALWQARKHGIAVEKTLLKEEGIYREEQDPKNGSWTYSKTDSYSRDATTCAGLICLAIGHGVRDEIAAKQAGKTSGATAQKKGDIAKEDLSIAKALVYIGRPLQKGALAPGVVAKRQLDTDLLEKLNRQLYEKMQQTPTRDARLASDRARFNYYEALQADTAGPQLADLKKQMEATEDQWKAEAKRSGVQELIERIQEKGKEPDLSRGMIFDADAWGDLYFLWSVERVAVIYNLERIGNRDWYAWGKKFILKNQKPDGSWQERFPGVPDTCFALLFLKRANLVKDLTDKLQRLLAALVGRPGPAPPGPPLPVARET